MHKEHTFLVAITIADPPGRLSREQAEKVLHASLPTPNTRVVGYAPPEQGGPHVESWWVAEDDRCDGSDNDSAVYVEKGMQSEAFDLLLESSMTYKHNDPENGRDND